MNIVFKNSLKNIFCKPFRTILVVFAIFVCSLCAMLCFDLGGSITKILTSYLGNVSRADFMVMSGGSDISSLPEGFPEADYMTVVGNEEILYKKIDGEYCYVTTNELDIYGLDIDEAVDMKFVSWIDIGYGEMFISKDFAEDFGYEVGDKITIHDRAKEEVELTISGIFPENTKNPILTGYCAIVNMETSDLISCGYREADILLIDLKDNSGIEEAKDLIKDTFPDATTMDLFLSDEDMALMNEISAVFYLMFAITFLLVIFVTASICNRIVSERMSYIGTLRSLGMSTSRTARILLLENVLYALLGSVPAVVFYSLIRDGMLDTLFTLETENGSIPLDMPSLPVSLVIGVVAGAVLIECLIPLKAILKALKTSIRDIIFDNRDTEYRFSRFTFVSGLILLVTAIVTFILRNNIFCAILCLISAVAALAFLFPRLLKLVSKGVHKIADKNENSAWSLASVEAVSRKSTVGSGVLSATAAAMCVVVYALSTAMAGTVNAIPYNCNVVMETNKTAEYYSYIEHLEGVTEVELIYGSLQETKVDTDEKNSVVKFYGLPDGGFRNFTGFSDLPETIESGNVIVDKKFASRKGYSKGDSVKITINPDGALPIEREYRIQDITEGNPYDSGIIGIVLSEKDYKTLFLDYPGCILITAEDPDQVKESLEIYGKGTYSKVQTLDEIIEETKTNNSRTVAVITVIIAISLGMTAIGMISNQLLGFEGRKKECAILLATSMNKGKLSGILLKEVLITSITASGIGTIIGSILTFVLQSAMNNSEVLVMDVQVDPVKNILFFLMMTVVFTSTVLFPIRNLRKMKISEQLKYE